MIVTAPAARHGGKMGIDDNIERKRRFTERYKMHCILRQGKKRPPPKSAQKEYCENLSREFAHSVSQAFFEGHGFYNVFWHSNYKAD